MSDNVTSDEEIAQFAAQLNHPHLEHQIAAAVGHLFTPWRGQTRRGAAGGNHSPQGGAQGAAALASCRQ